MCASPENPWRQPQVNRLSIVPITQLSGTLLSSFGSPNDCSEIKKQLVNGEAFLMANPNTIEIEGVGLVMFERSKRATRLNISVRPFKAI